MDSDTINRIGGRIRKVLELADAILGSTGLHLGLLLCAWVWLVVSTGNAFLRMAEKRAEQAQALGRQIYATDRQIDASLAELQRLLDYKRKGRQKRDH